MGRKKRSNAKPQSRTLQNFSESGSSFLKGKKNVFNGDDDESDIDSDTVRDYLEVSN